MINQPFRTGSDLSLYIINVHTGKLYFVLTQLSQALFSPTIPYGQ